MNTIKNNLSVFILSGIFLAISLYFVFNDNYFILAFPLGLALVYFTVIYPKTLFLALAFLAPLSINLEFFTEGKIGLFVPTEPILLMLMFLLVFYEIKNGIIDQNTWRNPITISIIIYVLWIFITAITSTHPDVSFKFLLMKLWFIVPLIFLGSLVFEKKENIVRFIWLFAIGMSIVIVYTVIIHYSYGFGEKEGHWVMWPFFKDHTSYGAAIAINFFFVLGLWLYKKHNAIIQFVLISLFLITVIGLYFSYTRGAWLSVIVAFAVWLLIKYKIKFKYLLSIALAGIVVLFLNWSELNYMLSKNRAEHTTEDFQEKMQSAANMTSDASNLERLNRWDAAVQMFLEKPIFGFGPGTYAFEYAPFQDPGKTTIISTNFGDGGNAHSEYLGPLAETGLIGLITVLLLVGVLFFKSITLYIKLPDDFKALKTITLFITLAFVTYFVHGFINNYLDTDKAAVPVYGGMAIIIAIENFYLKNKKELENRV